MRMIDADALMDLLKARKQFFVDAYGGSFHCMSGKDKARCDEIDACIASIVNAPIVSARAEQVTGKLNNPCDSLLKSDSNTCKESKSKLDLISRQDAIAYFFRPYSNEELYSNIDIEKALKSLPSAPDSRQRGEWVYGIDDETGEKDLYAWTCSVCNKEYPWQPNYCPNCGADMRGEEE